MKHFTKDDLKDGDKIYMTEGSIHSGGEKNDTVSPFYVCGMLAVQFKINYPSVYIRLSGLTEGFVTDNGQKVAKIYREGTVLFEREPEVKEMTVAYIERERGYSVKVVK